MFALPIFPGSRPWGLSAYMSLTSVFGMGSDGSGAGGGYSDLSEWQRSADDEAAPAAKNMPGSATRNRWTRPPFPGKSKTSYFRRRFCVRVTYLPGQSPAKYCQRT